MVQTRPFIAVLDDEPQFCKALARLLKTHSFEVMTFTRGEDFLTACTRKACSTNPNRTTFRPTAR
jgi:FixJ family two-component response regulator